MLIKVVKQAERAVGRFEKGKKIKIGGKQICFPPIG